VGAVLLVIDEGRRIVRLDPADAISPRRPVHWSRGDRSRAAAMEPSRRMDGDAVLASFGAPFRPSQSLFLTGPLPGWTESTA